MLLTIEKSHVMQYNTFISKQNEAIFKEEYPIIANYVGVKHYSHQWPFKYLYSSLQRFSIECRK